MLFISPGKGFALPDGYEGSGGNAVSSVCGFSRFDPLPDPRAAVFSPMGYFLDRTPVSPGLSEDRVVRLAGAMERYVTSRPDQSGLDVLNASLARFYLHDICAPAIRVPPPEGYARTGALPRPFVEASLANLRPGHGMLDAIYSGACVQGSVARMLRDKLRDADNPGLMRTGRRGSSPDILRLRDLLKSGDKDFVARLKAELPDDLLPRFFDETGLPLRAAAIVPDTRNAADERLARLSLVFLGLHNAEAQRLAVHDDDPDATFDTARERVVAKYHQMLVNEFLPAVADPLTVEEVRLAGTPGYDAFITAMKPPPDLAAPVSLEVAFAVLPVLQLLSAGAVRYCLADAVANGARYEDDDVLGFPSDTIVSAIPPEMRAGTRPEKRALRSFIRYHIALGERLNLPNAEDCVNAFQHLDTHIRPPDYSREMAALGMGGIVPVDTPLFVYLWVEAVVTGRGRRLGPLGSRLLSEHMIGQIARLHSLRKDQRETAQAVDPFSPGPEITLAGLAGDTD